MPEFKNREEYEKWKAERVSVKIKGSMSQGEPKAEKTADKGDSPIVSIFLIGVIGSREKSKTEIQEVSKTQVENKAAKSPSQTAVESGESSPTEKLISKEEDDVHWTKIIAINLKCYEKGKEPSVMYEYKCLDRNDKEGIENDRIRKNIASARSTGGKNGLLKLLEKDKYLIDRNARYAKN